VAISLARYFVSIRGDFTVFRAEVAAEATRLSRTSFEVKPKLELTSFRAQWSVFAARYLADQTITIRPVLAPGGLSRSAFRARDLAIKVRLDLTAFRAQWRIFAATYLNVIHRIHVHPVISPTAVSGVIDAFSTAGERSGSAFGGGFSMRWKLIIGALVAALPLLQPLIGVLGSIVQAAGAVGAALPLAIAATGVLVATLALSFHNLGDAIEGAFSGDPTKKQRQAFEKLAPAAKEFVGVLLETKTLLKGFQTEVQQAFFEPFLVGFRSLVASPAIKQLRTELVLIGRDAGEAGGAVSRAFADSARSGQLATILAGIRGSLGSLLNLSGPLTKMFLTLAQFAQPFADMLVNKIVSGVTQLTMLVEQSAANGALAKFFEDGATSLSQLMRLVVNVGSIFDSIFDGITGDSNTFLESLSVLTGQFATFLESAEGQAILGLLADKLALIGEVISGVLGPVLPLAIQLAQIIGGAMSDAIRTVLPMVTEFLLLLVSGLQPILRALAPVFEALVGVVADFVEQGLVELGAHVGRILPDLVDLAEKLGPELIPLVEALGESLMALLPLIPALSDFIIALLPTLIDLTPAFIAIIQAIAWLAQGSTVLVEVIVTVIAWFLRWSNTITAYRAVLEIAARAVITAWDAVVSWFQTKIVVSLGNAVNDVKSFFTGLANFTRAMVAGWQQTFQNLINWFRTSFVAPISDLVVNKIPHAFRTGVDLIQFWWDRLKGVTRAPVDFFVNVIVNKGIIGTFNKVAGWIPGMGKLEPVGGFHAGGEYSGEVAGPPSTADNRVARGPNGEAIGLATGEMVVNSRQTRKHRGLLHAINAGILGYADGGMIGAIMDPAGWVKDQIGDLVGKIPGGGRMVNILAGLGSKMVSALVEFVKSKLGFGAFGGDMGPTGAGPGFGAWPSSPGAQRGDSGVWRSVVSLIRSTGPPSGSFGNAYRPGDPLWHGSGRAVDWMGYNQDALAGFFMSIMPRVLELIHTTNKGGYYITRGRRRASMGRQDALHRDHIHIAMAEGGLIGRVMDSGGYMMPGWNPPTFNGTGKPELVLPSGATVGLDGGTIAALASAIAGALTGGMSSARRLGRQYA
jgi:hypothetical protein